MVILSTTQIILLEGLTMNPPLNVCHQRMAEMKLNVTRYVVCCLGRSMG